MLVWWILSVVILIVCSIFAYRMIVSTYEFLPAHRRYLLKFYKNPVSQNGEMPTHKAGKINRKPQPLKDATFYEMQFSKFQDRLKVLEELNTLKFTGERNIKSVKEDEEDWKEMYYEENTIKEKLENDLDYTRQMLGESEEKLKDLSEKNKGWVILQSEYESRQHDFDSLREHTGLLKRQLEASTQREDELEQLLLNEITMREKFSLLQRQHLQLQSEADGLRVRIAELNKEDVDLQKRVIHIGELESKLALCNEEKNKMNGNVQRL